VPNLRGKTLIKEYDSFPTLEDLPIGVSTAARPMQADGSNSDCILKPVARLSRTSHPQERRLVMCEVMLPDGTPHPSNTAPPS
jgi:glutamine synthetase